MIVCIVAAISMDRDTLDKQARPVNMAAPTQEFLRQQLEQRCTTVSFPCLNGCPLVLCKLSS